jgi:hypothetical protein
MIVQGVDRSLSTPALYYPYADFQSEAWVKLALLNWSRIERIKPSSYPIEDRAATQLLFDLDWLQDIAPNPYQLRTVTDQFEEFLNHFGQHLQAKYAVDQRDSWPKAHFGTAPPGADERLAYVYASHGADVDKMTYRLRATFGNLGLGLLELDDDDSMWLGLHPQLAAMYMCALTEVIADDRQLVPVTDDQRVHRAAGRSSLHRLEEALTGRPEAAAKPSADEVESQYVEIALRSVLQPVNLDELPIERVIEFRGTHEPELRAFHDHVFDLSKEILTICQIADAEEIRYRLRDLYKSRTEPELEDLQEQLRKFGIRSVLGFFQLRIDKDTAIQTIGSAAAMAGAHILLGPAAPVVVPFAISAVAVPYVRRRRQEKERLEHKSPASLLLALKRELVDDAAGS